MRLLIPKMQEMILITRWLTSFRSTSCSSQMCQRLVVKLNCKQRKTLRMGTKRRYRTRKSKSLNSLSSMQDLITVNKSSLQIRSTLSSQEKLTRQRSPMMAVWSLRSSTRSWIQRIKISAASSALHKVALVYLAMKKLEVWIKERLKTIHLSTLDPSLNKYTHALEPFTAYRNTSR